MSMFYKIVIFVAIVSNLSANGQTVSDQVLNEYANNFILENFPGGARQIKSVVPLIYDNLKTLNLFELEPEGWLLLSADLKVEPVIGFSFTGHFKMPDVNIYDPMYNWLSSYQREIRKIITDESLKGRSGWTKAQRSIMAKGTSAITIRVTPFMTVNWGQGKNFNQFCPADADGPGGHVYVGCVAVSLAQAMSVFKIPEKGQGYNNYLDPKYGSQFANFGNTFYKWDSMSVSVSDKYNSLLLYHCAVAVNMNFGSAGSGTQTLYAASALRNYFRFSQNVLYKNRSGTDIAWQTLLNAELLKGRPIIYSGDADDGNPGHAFNIDGVINSTYFHINWGWTGSNNGYYTLNTLNPASNDFSKNQSAILGIQPLYYPTDIRISDTIVREYQPSGTFVGIVKITDEANDNTYTLKLVCDSVFSGTGWVRNFYLNGDSLMTGRTFTGIDNRIDTVAISLKDNFKNTFSKKIAISITDTPTGFALPEAENSGLLTLFPNPAKDRIYINLKTPTVIISVRIYSMSGALIQRINNTNPENGIPVNALNEGFYILEAELENHILIRKKFFKF